MVAVIVIKVFDNHDQDLTSTSTNYIFIFDKFTLKTFNQLFYGQKINKLLVASYLLHLSNHYS